MCMSVSKRKFLQLARKLRGTDPSAVIAVADWISNDVCAPERWVQEFIETAGGGTVTEAQYHDR